MPRYKVIVKRRWIENGTAYIEASNKEEASMKVNDDPEEYVKEWTDEGVENDEIEEVTELEEKQ